MSINRNRNEEGEGSQIVECVDTDQFQLAVDQGAIAHMVTATHKEVYGTVEHREIIPILELISAEIDIDDCVFGMMDAHHDYYNYKPSADVSSANWVPHAFRLGLLPSPDNPNAETYPFILIAEQSDELGDILIDTPTGQVTWDGKEKINLPGINEAKGGVTLIPTSYEDAIVELIQSLILLPGKRLIVNIDLDFGQVDKIYWGSPDVRYESMTEVPWIRKLLTLADIVIMNRSPFFNSKEHYSREENAILEFLQREND